MNHLAYVIYYIIFGTKYDTTYAPTQYILPILDWIISSYVKFISVRRNL